MINVEVCYARPEKQHLVSLEVPMGCSVINAIMASGILDNIPEIDLSQGVGIFSKKVSLEHILTQGDRVEIYRPLILTPNQARLRRAKKK